MNAPRPRAPLPGPRPHDVSPQPRTLEACWSRRHSGYSVPSIVEPEYIEIRRCTADFVLLVEKGTQWNRLSEDKFWRAGTTASC